MKDRVHDYAEPRDKLDLAYSWLYTARPDFILDVCSLLNVLF